MPPPKLWLHAGVHKTGTTAIQQFASWHRHTLFERGLWYPDFSPIKEVAPPSHNRLAHSLVDPGVGRGLGQLQVRNLVDYWRENAGERSLLVSAEAFCRHVAPNGGGDWLDQRKTYLEVVAETFRGFDVEVILVLRRQDVLAHSLYLENIMKGSRRGRMPFPEFREYVKARHLRFEENIAAFKEAFGSVRVLTYEGLVHNGCLFRDFFASFGYCVGDLQDPGRIRRSLTVGQARLKRALLPVVFSRSQNRALNGMLKRGPVARVLDRIVVEPDLGFWESKESRRRWLKTFAAENERLRRRFFAERAAMFLPESAAPND